MGLLGVFKRPKKKPKRGPGEDLPPEVKMVVSLLRNVIDSEAEVNVVDEGRVYGVTVDGLLIWVFFLFASSTPDCHFCQALAINVQRRILRDTIEALKKEGFKRVEIYNEIGLLLEEWGDKDGSA